MSDLDCTPRLGSYVFTDALYDEGGDLLYLSVGLPSESLTWESPEGHLVRVDPDTLDVVGLTVMGFAARRAQGSISVTVPTQDELRALIGAGHTEELLLPDDFLATCR